MSTCIVYDDRRRARDLIGQRLAAVPGVHRVIAVVSADELILRLDGEPGLVAIIGTQRGESGGTDAIRRVLAVQPSAVVMAVGSRDDAPTVRAAVAAGARAFMRWDATPDVVATLIHAVTEPGSVHLPISGATAPDVEHSAPEDVEGPPAWAPGPSAAVVGRLSDVVTHPGVQMELGISGREMQVLGGMSEGMSNAEIGRELYLADNTVKSLARRMFRKLGVHERAHAVARAYRLGLFGPSDGDVHPGAAALGRSGS